MLQISICVRSLLMPSHSCSYYIGRPMRWGAGVNLYLTQCQKGCPGGKGGGPKHQIFPGILHFSISPAPTACAGCWGCSNTRSSGTQLQKYSCGRSMFWYPKGTFHSSGNLNNVSLKSLLIFSNDSLHSRDFRET